jgi:hypothetical protein
VARLVLDAGGLGRLAERSTRAVALLSALRSENLWPPVVPSVVLVESLTGHPGRDAGVNRLLRACTIAEAVPEALARRAARLRATARRGSAVDALVVALAEPGGVVLTSDLGDLRALGSHALDVTIERA